jgi:hypothetical protein
MTRTPRKMKPRKESKKKMRPFTRDAFHGLLNRAITPQAEKPAPR